jgi:PTS system mannose-specific IIB component/fructoselysine and glucoselysine-specific PTS system IIB component
MGIERIILVDDQVAGSTWEQDLYRMAVPLEMQLAFASVAQGGPLLAEWHAAPMRTLLLTGDIPTMATLQAADGAVVHNVNLGGLHHRPGRRQRLPYVYLTDDEYANLRRIEAGGAVVTAQDVPTAVRTPLKGLG